MKKKITREKINAPKMTAIYGKQDKGYIAYVEEMPGVLTQGDTLKETRSNIKDALKLMLETNRLIAQGKIKLRKLKKKS